MNNRAAATLVISLAPIALIVLGLAACTSAQTEGPMELGGSDAVACLPADRDLGEGFFFGEWVGNRGGSQLVITDVELRDPVNFQLVSASAIGVEEAIGAVVDPAASAGWDERASAVGSRVAPGQHVNVVVQVRLQDAAADGQAAGFDVHYSDGSSDFVDSSTVVFQVSQDCDATMTAWGERPR